MRRRWLVAAIVLLVAFGLRMVRLQNRPLWYDEAFATLYASLSPKRMLYGTVTPVRGAGAADVHPLLYYFLLHSWMELAGRSPLAARFLSVILGMTTVALLWRLAAWCFDRRVGAATGLLAGVNPFHVAYSQEARMYALLGLAAVLAAWSLLRALQKTRRRWWALYTAAGALVLYAHNLGAFVLLALHALVLIRRQWRRHLLALALADVGVLALFSPWLIGVLPGQIGFIGRGYWLSPPGAEEIVRTVMLPVMTFYEPTPAWLLGLGLFTGLLLLALIALRACQTRSRASWFLLLCWAPILMLLLLSRWRPLYLERALLPSALFYLVAAAWLLTHGGIPRLIRLGLTILLLGSTLGSLGIHYTYTSFPRPPFQKAAVYLQAHVEPGDAVVHTNKLTYFPMRVYGPNLPGDFLADPSGSPQDTLAYPTQEALGLFAAPTITQAVGGAEQVWLVYFPREVAQMGWQHPALDWLDGRFAAAEREWFNDLVVAHYRREGR